MSPKESQEPTRTYQSKGTGGERLRDDQGELLWHYTPYLENILQDGVIRFALPISRRAKPAVWFSSNQVWEQTVQKGPVVGPQFGLEAHATLGIGRIGVLKSIADPWRIAWVKQRATLKTARMVAELGRFYGGDPREWYAVDREVLRSEWRSVEVYASGQWVYFNPEVHSSLFPYEHIPLPTPKKLTDGRIAHHKMVRKSEPLFIDRGCVERSNVESDPENDLERVVGAT